MATDTLTMERAEAKAVENIRELSLDIQLKAARTAHLLNGIDDAVDLICNGSAEETRDGLDRIVHFVDLARSASADARKMGERIEILSGQIKKEG